MSALFAQSVLWLATVVERERREVTTTARKEAIRLKGLVSINVGERGVIKTAFVLHAIGNISL